MGSEVFSGRNQSNGCAVAWVTIARDSESEYTFQPVGQLYRVRAGYSWRQMCSSLTNLSLSVSSGSYCTGAIVGSRVYSNTLATFFALPFFSRAAFKFGRRAHFSLRRKMLKPPIARLPAI